MESRSEKACSVAMKLYEARSTLRRLYPDCWREKISPAVKLIKQHMELDKCDEISATLHIVKWMKDQDELNAGAMMLVLAACVEMCEPTPERG